MGYTFSKHLRHFYGVWERVKTTQKSESILRAHKQWACFKVINKPKNPLSIRFRIKHKHERGKNKDLLCSNLRSALLWFTPFQNKSSRKAVTVSAPECCQLTSFFCLLDSVCSSVETDLTNERCLFKLPHWHTAFEKDVFVCWKKATMKMCSSTQINTINRPW